MRSANSKGEWDKRAFWLAVGGQIGLLVVAAGVLFGRRAGFYSAPLAISLLIVLVIVAWWQSQSQWNRIGRFKVEVEKRAPGLLASHGLSTGGTVMRSDRLRALESVADDPRIVADAALGTEARVVSGIVRGQRVGSVAATIAVIFALGLLFTATHR